MAVAHQRQLAAVTQHYQRQMQDFAAYFWGLQIPGMQQHELPASIFAPPPFPVPTPIETPNDGAVRTRLSVDPPLGPSPPHGWPAHPTFPTQGFTWPGTAPPPPTQQGHSGPYSTFQAALQLGWSPWEQGGGSGAPGDAGSS
ncbi:unnamed protein product [Miscanthus lutarioriparius]|uniref:Uncharacterized protein n=1 Tax=Miscanthus lutarioriparius TaxID=422564 RepID=A0A811PCB5_9POAL|nr:unnamed protein product [Miscanthus lutarioriparius]